MGFRILELIYYIILVNAAGLNTVLFYMIGLLAFLLEFVSGIFSKKNRWIVYSLTCTGLWVLAGAFFPMLIFEFTLGFFLLVQCMLWLDSNIKRHLPLRFILVWLNLLLTAILMPNHSNMPIYILALAFFTLFLPFSQNLGGNNFRKHAFQCLRLLLFSVIFSLMIFPFLPRNTSGVSLPGEAKSIGYTESISLGEKLALQETGGDTVLLQIFQPIAERKASRPFDLNDIFLGLMKGRVLDRFDGTTWTGDPQFIRNNLESNTPHKRNEKETVIEVLRDPIRSVVAPIPYGTIQARSENQPTSNEIFNTRKGEWVDLKSEELSLNYTITVLPNQLSYLKTEVNPSDQNLENNIFVPDILNNKRMNRLSSKLFSNTQSPWEKIGRLRDFFRTEKFSASLGGKETWSGSASPAISRLHPVELFLFAHKEGHCELFATSAAILLRMGGIPTRMVTGFRASTLPVAELIKIYQKDAHAWIEAWIDTHGWFPLDFTPRVIRSKPWWSLMSSQMDWIGAQWLKYILSFNVETNTYLSKGNILKTKDWIKKILTLPIHKLKEILWKWKFVLLAALFLCGGVLILWDHLEYLLYRIKLLTRGAIESSAASLRNEKAAFERLLPKRFIKKETNDFDYTAASKYLRELYGDIYELQFRRWISLYEAARFGNTEEIELSQNLISLKNYRILFSKTLSNFP